MLASGVGAGVPPVGHGREGDRGMWEGGREGSKRQGRARKQSQWRVCWQERNRERERERERVRERDGPSIKINMERPGGVEHTDGIATLLGLEVQIVG